MELAENDSEIEQVSFQGNAATTNADLVSIRDLRNISRIDLDYTAINDISPLKNQVELRFLDLQETDIDSNDLENLEHLNKLRVLILAGTKISSDGLQYVSDMTELVVLELNDTAICDDCLVYFKHLKSLREINLQNTKVSLEGVRRLQIDLPNCEIKHNVGRN